MLANYAGLCLLGIVLFLLLGMIVAVFAYLVNAKRAADDPRKKNFPLSAVVFAVLRLPLWLLISLSLLILKSLAYGVFLLLFSIALLVFQHSDLPDWLEDGLAQIGNKLSGID
jgi:MFS-type transporter involved in bile tolerance (Atg22 family)